MTFREYFKSRKKIIRDGRNFKKNRSNVSLEQTEHFKNLAAKAEAKTQAKLIKKQEKELKKAAKGK